MVTGPHRAEIQEVEPPTAAPGEAVVDVHRAGICGTDVELFTGEMQYLHTRHAEYPIRIGHEWAGTVSAVGDGVDPAWLGVRVTGDTMLGCGVCRRCEHGLQHLCAFRYELGIRGGKPGALAGQVATSVRSLHRLPGNVDDAMGAMVEPGGNAFRAVEAAGLGPGDRCLVLGPGTIGLLCALFARAAGAEVHLLGQTERSLSFARSLGFPGAQTGDDLPDLPWRAVIDASNAPHLPARAVEPGGRVVYVGLAGTPSLIDTRDLVLKDVAAVGVLSASPGLIGTIDAYAAGAVDRARSSPRPCPSSNCPRSSRASILPASDPAPSSTSPPDAHSPDSTMADFTGLVAVVTGGQRHRRGHRAGAPQPRRPGRRHRLRHPAPGRRHPRSDGRHYERRRGPRRRRAADGIRANAIAPGTADTPRVHRLLAASDDPETTAANLRGRQPMGRLVTAEELAFAIANLASPRSASTTETVLIVDGGLTSLRVHLAGVAGRN